MNNTALNMEQPPVTSTNSNSLALCCVGLNLDASNIVVALPNIKDDMTTTMNTVKIV